MWRRRIAFSSSCVSVAARTLFTRDLRTPIEIKRGSTTYPAVLLWRWRSSAQRHLVLSVQSPLDAEEKLLTSAKEGKDTASKEHIKPEDYFFGRVFLRPYNVAQLLTVLEGKVERMVLNKTHSSLQLEPAVSLSQSAKAGGRRKVTKMREEKKAGDGVATPNSFLLIGELTTKTAAPSDIGDTVDEFDQAEDPPAYSTYNLNDRRAFSAKMEGADLIFIVNHLNAVLGDMFGIEHQYHTRVAHELLRKQQRSGWIHSQRHRRDTPALRTPQYRSETCDTDFEPPVSPRPVVASSASAPRAQLPAAPLASATPPAGPAPASPPPDAESGVTRAAVAAAAGAVGAAGMAQLQRDAPSGDDAKTAGVEPPEEFTPKASAHNGDNRGGGSQNVVAERISAATLEEEEEEEEEEEDLDDDEFDEDDDEEDDETLDDEQVEGEEDTDDVDHDEDDDDENEDEEDDETLDDELVEGEEDTDDVDDDDDETPDDEIAEGEEDDDDDVENDNEDNTDGEEDEDEDEDENEEEEDDEDDGDDEDDEDEDEGNDEEEEEVRKEPKKTPQKSVG